jgi:hypothetical protein
MDANGVLKISQWKFICHQHDEFIARSNLTLVSATPKKKPKQPKLPVYTTPESIVSSWGLPERMISLLRVRTMFYVI